jgi:hypothetical protein
MPTNAEAWIATAILILAGLGCLMWGHWGVDLILEHLSVVCG